MAVGDVYTLPSDALPISWVAPATVIAADGYVYAAVAGFPVWTRASVAAAGGLLVYTVNSAGFPDWEPLGAPVAGWQIRRVAGLDTVGAADGALGTNSLTHPYALAWGIDGKLYVSDSSDSEQHNAVRVFDPTTGAVTTATGLGTLNAIRGLAFLVDGTLVYYGAALDADAPVMQLSLAAMSSNPTTGWPDAGSEPSGDVTPLGEYAGSSVGLMCDVLNGGNGIGNIAFSPDHSLLYLCAPWDGGTAQPGMLLALRISDLKYIAVAGLWKGATPYPVPIAGATSEHLAEGAAALASQVANVVDAVVASDGTITLLSEDIGCVRQIAPDGTIQSLTNYQDYSAWDSLPGGDYTGDGSPALAVAGAPGPAQFNAPMCLAQGVEGILVGDTGNNVIRLIAPSVPTSTRLYFTNTAYSGADVQFGGDTATDLTSRRAFLSLTDPGIDTAAYFWNLEGSAQSQTFELFSPALAAQTIPAQDWTVRASFQQIGSGGIAAPRVALLLLNADGTLSSTLGSTAVALVDGEDLPDAVLSLDAVTVTEGMILLLGVKLEQDGGDSSSEFRARTGACLFSPALLQFSGITARPGLLSTIAGNGLLPTSGTDLYVTLDTFTGAAGGLLLSPTNPAIAEGGYPWQPYTYTNSITLSCTSPLLTAQVIPAQTWGCPDLSTDAPGMAVDLTLSRVLADGTLGETLGTLSLSYLVGRTGLAGIGVATGALTMAEGERLHFVLVPNVLGGDSTYSFYGSGLSVHSPHPLVLSGLTVPTGWPTNDWLDARTVSVQPNRMIYDPMGLCYYLTMGDRDVTVPSGIYQLKQSVVNGLAGPRGLIYLDLTPGQVWVVNSTGNSISRFHSDATLAGPLLTGNGLNQPINIVDTGTEVWVSNAGNSTISRFTYDGTSSGAPIVAHDDTDGDINPGALLSNNPGDFWHVYVASRTNDKLFDFDATAGTYIGPIAGSAGHGISGEGLAAWIGPTLYASNGAGGHLELLSADGTWFDSFVPTGLSSPRGMALHGGATHQELWTVNASPAQLCRSDQYVASVGSPFTGNGLDDPYGIAYLNDTGDLWVTNTAGSGSISRFHSDGTSAGDPLTAS